MPGACIKVQAKAVPSYACATRLCHIQGRSYSNSSVCSVATFFENACRVQIKVLRLLVLNVIKIIQNNAF